MENHRENTCTSISGEAELCGLDDILVLLPGTSLALSDTDISR